MLNILKIGHAEFEVRDMSRMVAHYEEVLGLTVTDRDAKTTYLSTALDHHTMVLRRGEGETKLATIAFQVEPTDGDDLIRHLGSHGLQAEARMDSEPGIGTIVRVRNPDGVAIDLYSGTDPLTRRHSGRGVNPHKLSHVAALCLDARKTMAFYTDVLGFRFSDEAGGAFFLRCGADHHTINLFPGEHAGLQHIAFELDDMSHIGQGCNVLAGAGIDTLWGPLRHGAGHNLAVYHLDPEGQIVEFCAEMDRMSNEALGHFDPRPWHEDHPQRPKVWEDPKAGGISWGQFPPPDRFARGMRQG